MVLLMMQLQNMILMVKMLVFTQLLMSTYIQMLVSQQELNNLKFLITLLYIQYKEEVRIVQVMLVYLLA